MLITISIPAPKKGFKTKMEMFWEVYQVPAIDNVTIYVQSIHKYPYIYIYIHTYMYVYIV